MYNAGAKVAFEPLNAKFNFLEKEYSFNKNDLLNASREFKIGLIDSVLKDYPICKILYYQIDDHIINNLKDKHRIILLTRNPFDSYISFRIAEYLNIWHNLGREKIIPKEKEVKITKEKMIYGVCDFLNRTLKYIPYSSNIVSYQELVDNWDEVIKFFSNIIGFNGEVKQTIFKNPENPKDFIENYDELKNIYLTTFGKLELCQK